jgi:hypothetical protein
VSLGAQTVVVNGQRFQVPTTAAYNPQGYGPQTTGAPSTVPQAPPAIGAAGGTISSVGLSQNAAQAAAQPHSLKWSPVWWAVIFLVLSLILLKGVHWRETMLVGAEERAEAGPFTERAEARVD